MTIEKITNRVIFPFLVVVILFDSGLWIYLKAAEIYGPQDPNLVYRSQAHPQYIPPPIGFSKENQNVSPVANANGRWAIRYASPKCHFSEEDEKRWSKLASQLRIKGYQIITLVPDGERSYSVGAQSLGPSLQEVYVDLGWLKHFRLSGTPTLLIFEGSHGLIWSHQGELSIFDPINALHEIDYWGKH